MLNIRCEMVVQLELKQLGFQCTAVEQGRAEVAGVMSVEQIQDIRTALSRSGLELIDNKKNVLIEKIKSVIIEMVHYQNDPLKVNFSDYLTSKLNLDYTYLANTFSQDQGVTIEHFIILNKIQRVKELISYNEFSLTEISWMMHYSSVAHLSAQFKKVTGVTPSCFKHQEHLS
jgi:YesN/AraC family two-component response regulator